MKLYIQDIIKMIDGNGDSESIIEELSLLNGEQTIAIEQLVSFVLTNKRGGRFKFTGFAGCGKSFVQVRLLKILEAIKDGEDYKIIAVTPSHKAKRNLIKMAREANLRLGARTISSFLGLKPILNEETGKEEFQRSSGGQNDFLLPSDYDLVIIDEAWMVQKPQLDMLESEVDGSIIYCGDVGQLPPVGEKESYLSRRAYPLANLIQVVRYSGDLARVIESWRSPNPKDRLPIAPTEDGSIIKLSKLDWVEQFADRTKASLESKDYESVRLICWTNEAVRKWTRWVRNEIHGDLADEKPFIVGERLVAKKPIFRKMGKTKLGDFELVGDNGTEVNIVREYQLAEIAIDTIYYPYYRIPCVDDFGITIDLFVLTELGEDLRDVKLEKARNEKRWGIYYELSKAFDSIAFYNIGTCHSAQGSTYGEAYLDVPNLNRCPQKQQMIYTALSRSKQAIIF